MSRFPFTVPTASSWELFAHSRNVIVSLKMQHSVSTHTHICQMLHSTDSFIQQNILNRYSFFVSLLLFFLCFQINEKHTWLDATFLSATDRHSNVNTKNKNTVVSLVKNKKQQQKQQQRKHLKEVSLINFFL